MHRLPPSAHSPALQSEGAREEPLRRRKRQTDCREYQVSPASSTKGELRQACLGWRQEVFNCMTMIPPALHLLLRPEPVLRYFTAAVCAHTAASMSFHVLLILSTLPSASAWRPPPRWVRRLMDLDMALTHCVNIANALTAYSMDRYRWNQVVDFNFVALLTLNVMGIAIISCSRSASQEELDRELNMVRYPLIGLTVFLEVWQRYNGGATDDALGMAVTMTLLSSFVFLDRRLGGWGHGIGHLILWLGTYYRANALAICFSAVGTSTDAMLP